jgi:hypothetical protein
MSATTVIASSRRTGQIGFVIAWGFCLLFYFGQYAIRSAPGVMVPERTTAFGLTILGVSSLLGLCYCTFSSFAIVAGAALDRFGPEYVIPTGIVVTAIGAVMFCLGSAGIAEAGNFLVFTPSALLAPAYGWLLNDLAGGGKLTETVFQNAGSFGVAGIVSAIAPACFLRETGSASRAAATVTRTAKATT